MATILKQKIIQNFLNNGYAGPFTLCSVKEMEGLRKGLEQLINTESSPEAIYSAVKPSTGDGNPIETVYDSHLNNNLALKLASHPKIVSLAHKTLGTGVCIWRTTFWIKPAGGKRIEWHQDTYKDEGFGVFPNMNAWIAVDETTENNCVWLVEGSHKEIIPLNNFQLSNYIDTLKDQDSLPAPPLYSLRNIKKMALKPGEFFIFDGRILHGSPPNKSKKRRAGFVTRFKLISTTLENLKNPSIPV